VFFVVVLILISLKTTKKKKMKSPAKKNGSPLAGRSTTQKRKAPFDSTRKKITKSEPSARVPSVQTLFLHVQIQPQLTHFETDHNYLPAPHIITDVEHQDSSLQLLDTVGRHVLLEWMEAVLCQVLDDPSVKREVDKLEQDKNPHYYYQSTSFAAPKQRERLDEVLLRSSFEFQSTASSIIESALFDIIAEEMKADAVKL
jgi:hypothetical protein